MSHLVLQHSKQKRRCPRCPNFLAPSALIWYQHMQEKHRFEPAPEPSAQSPSRQAAPRAPKRRKKKQKWSWEAQSAAPARDGPEVVILSD